MDTRQLLTERIAELKRLADKVKKGQSLSEEELASLNPRGAAYDSIANAAAALQLPGKLLRAAKKSGAPGFKGSRVYAEQLLPWLAAWLYQSSRLKQDEDYDRAIRAEKFRRVKFENDRDQSKFMPSDQVEREHSELAERLKNTLRARLEDEAPPVLAGLPAAAIRVQMKRINDEICRLMLE